VSALSRLWWTAQLPTLIVWGTPARFVEVLVDFIASTESARLPPHSTLPVDEAPSPD